MIRLAQARHRLDQRIEHGLQIEGGAADDLEHVGGGGLLLQRLTQFAIARLQLSKQPRILDGDHRLVGKGRHQFDLLVGERPHLGACQPKRPNRNAVPHTPPCCRAIVALSASQSWAADSTSVWSTACRSKVERLMTLSTSAVAVCRCNESRSSLRSRVFSMAITAWRAKCVTSSICLSVKGRTSRR